MVDPVTAALRFGFEVLLTFGGIAALFVVIARYYGLNSTFTYSVERSRVGWPFFVGLLVVGLGVTYLAYLVGLPRWGGDIQPGQLGFMVFTAGFGLLAYALTALPAYRTLAGSRRTDTVSVVDGDTVFCTGEVVATDGTTTAPVSGAAAVAWEVRTERETTTGFAHRTSTVTDVERIERDDVPFALEDETGRLRVDPTDTTLACSVGAVESDDDRERIERRLEPGEAVAVFGRVEGGVLTGADTSVAFVGDLRHPDAETPAAAFHDTGNRAGPAAAVVLTQVRRGIPLGAVIALGGLYVLFGL